MSKLKNLGKNKGIALVTALMFTLIALGIILGTYHMLMRSTELSGLFKRYQTAQEAALGAFEFFTKEFMRRTLQGENMNLPAPVFSPTEAVNFNCIRTKLTAAPSENGYTNCTGNSTGLNPSDQPDLIFHFNPFVAHLKITDTLEGNTDIGGVSLVGSGVVEAGATFISPPHIPYLYRIDILAQRESGAIERSWITGLYSY